MIARIIKPCIVIVHDILYSMHHDQVPLTFISRSIDYVIILPNAGPILTPPKFLYNMLLEYICSPQFKIFKIALASQTAHTFIQMNSAVIKVTKFDVL